MGTNYYLESTPPCKCCHRVHNGKHIGKSSAGWRFALRIYPEQGINTFYDWMKILSKEDVVIKNEYGDQVSFSDLVDNILNRSHPNGLDGESVDGQTFQYINVEFS